MLTYLENRRIDVPDRMLEPTPKMYYAAARGYSASLVAFDVDTNKPLGFVDVVKLGYTNARAWLSDQNKGS